MLVQTNEQTFSPPLRPQNSVHMIAVLIPNAKHDMIGLLDLERLDRPILLRVVQNGPVGTELAHLGTSADTLLQPLGLIQIRFIDQLEGVDVGLEVFREEVVIVVADGVQQPKQSDCGL